LKQSDSPTNADQRHPFLTAQVRIACCSAVPEPLHDWSREKKGKSFAGTTCCSWSNILS